MITDAFTALFAIGLAELGDKTQLSILLLSSKTKNQLHLLAGVMLAFLIVDGIAIAAGSWITNVLPERLLKNISCIVFIIFGILIWREKEEKGDGEKTCKSPFTSGFLLILLTEWGDKTQLAAGLLATRYDPLTVLAAAMIALFSLSAMAVFLGERLSGRIDRKRLSKIAGAVFVALGFSFLLF